MLSIGRTAKVIGSGAALPDFFRLVYLMVFGKKNTS